MEQITASLSKLRVAVFSEDRDLTDIQLSLQRWERLLEKHVFSSDPREMDEYEKGIKREADLLSYRMNVLDGLPGVNSNHQELTKEMEEAFQKAWEDQDRLLRSSRQGDKEKALEIFERDIFPDISNTLRCLDAHRSYVGEELERLFYESDVRYRSDIKRIVLTGLGAFSGFMVLGVLLSSLLVRRIYRIAAAAQITERWLVEGEKKNEAFPIGTLSIHSSDEIGHLAGSLNRLMESLKNNIADRKKAEQRIRANNEALELLNRELGTSYEELSRFAAVAAHDLRAPLSNVMLSIEMLRQSLTGRLSADDEHLIQVISRGVDRMSRQISSLYKLSKIEAADIQVEEVNLDETVEELLTGVLAPAIEKERAKVEVGRLGKVFANEAQVSSVLQNLIENALRYHRKDAPLELRISAREDGKMQRIEVRDNGIGIREEDRNVVFKMFSRLNREMSPEGLGMGLPHCKRIVERLGGEMGVESEFGKGSVFWFTLPMDKSLMERK